MIVQFYLEKLLFVIKEMEMMVLLIDLDGVVLVLDGYFCVFNEVKCINFVEGVCWMEMVVGINVIGMVFYISELVVI